MGCLKLEHSVFSTSLRVVHNYLKISVKSYAGAYRYGFNGMEKDDEHTQGKYDFGARIYDSRINRFLSIDPLAGEYIHFSPYLFAANNPILCIDKNGENYEVTVDRANKAENGNSTIKISTTIYVGQDDLNKFKNAMSGQSPTDAIKSELSMSNSFNVNNKKGEDGKMASTPYEVKIGDETFNVEFDVKIKVVADRDAAKSAAQADRYGNYLRYEKHAHRKAFYAKSKDKSMPGLISMRGKVAGGGLTFSHELSHAFGLDHFSKKGKDGYYNISSYQRKRKVQNNDVSLIVENAVSKSKGKSKATYTAEVSSFASDDNKKTITNLIEKK